MARGDRSAFLDCVRQYGKFVTAIAARAISDRHEREDIVQEIFFDVWRTSPRFDAERGSELSFIATIARRRVIDRLRNKQRAVVVATDEQDVDQFAAGDQADGVGKVETWDELGVVRDAMRQLRSDERQVIELSILHGMKQTEIAEQMNAPLGTVKSLARRGMIRLRELVSAGTRRAGEATTDWEETRS
ncbi:MAG: sigma-70 family RNA polymerase sigma factor [Pirellulaceae bacterium]